MRCGEYLEHNFAGIFFLGPVIPLTYTSLTLIVAHFSKNKSVWDCKLNVARDLPKACIFSRKNQKKHLQFHLKQTNFRHFSHNTRGKEPMPAVD